MTGYPQRDKFFALRFCRLLTKRCLAQETGSLGTWLLTVIVHQEDAAHYRRGVTFYDGQLMPLLGINSKKSMTATRKKLIESGWLHFEPGHKGKASIYWVLVPREAEGLDDLPTDEGLEGFGSQKEPHSTDSVPFGNLKGHTSGTERGALLPNPNPNPHHPVGDDPFTRKKPCQGILKQLTGYTAEVTSRAWGIACQFARLNPGHRSMQTAAKIVGRFAGCISNHGLAAATRIESYFSLVDPAAWQAEVDAGKRLSVDASPLDVCNHLFPRQGRKPVVVPSNPTMIDPTIERLQREKAEAEKHAAKPGAYRKGRQRILATARSSDATD